MHLYRHCGVEFPWTTHGDTIMNALPAASGLPDVDIGDQSLSLPTGEIVAAQVVDNVLPAAPAPPTTSLQLSPAVAGLLNSRLAVIGLLLIAGPLGLPALWLSGRFSRGVKIVTTAIYFLLTVVFPLALTYYCCEIALRPLVDAFAGK